MAGEESDEELLIHGGADDFGRLYERRLGVVRGYLRARIGAQPDLVLDLVAETFARALERRSQFDPKRGTVVTWLLAIARNLLIDAVRTGRVDETSRRRLAMERIVLEESDLEWTERDAGSELERSLARLPAGQREAVERRIVDEEPYAAIASHVGCSEQVVRKRVSRGLAALRRNAREGA
ncbi:MAG TPA: sigma-70 family RNA polymerase sigma factor [Solirubrobacteraceae bacterium]|jgi:RNA polymerase sigma-70 factor (ECF subfamily)|nr:sigma-70 family RNA polymerase sigma factor [Solirubrobacteraceae bacterium]